MKAVQERDIVVCVLLSIVTCGIYGIIWFIQLTDDMKTVSGDNSLSGGRDFLLTLITCGIYGYYWAYKMGKAEVVAKTNNNLPSNDNSILYLILQIVGLGIVNYCLMQNELNGFAKQNAQ